MINTNNPLKVMVTGAAGQIAYSLLPLLASGSIFGESQKIDLHLLDIPFGQEIMNGVVLELQDSRYPLLTNILPTTDSQEAFSDIDVAILIGGFPRRKGMDRKDLINKNVPIFKSMGENLDKYAKPTCKILVVANPANTNCLVALKNCPNIPKENFTCLTMLDHNRALSQLSLHLKEPIENIKNVVIWGNHSKTQYPDISNVQINNNKLVLNDSFDLNKFIEKVQYRGNEVIKLRKLSSAMSAAKAIVDHLRIWLVTGTKDNEYISMGVYSNVEYEIAKDIIFSFPCQCKNGEYKIIQNLDVNNFISKIKESEIELLEEKNLSNLL
jgi:malate dehydrogenase